MKRELSEKELNQIYETFQTMKEEIGVVRDHLLDLGHTLMDYHLMNALDQIEELENMLFGEASKEASE